MTESIRVIITVVNKCKRNSIMFSSKFTVIKNNKAHIMCSDGNICETTFKILKIMHNPSFNEHVLALMYLGLRSEFWRAI